MDQRFTSAEVVSLTGITPRQLQWWDERGIVVPIHEGHRRLYSPDDLAEVAVICELRRRGFSLQRVRKVMRFVQKEFGKRLVETVAAGSEYHLLTDGTHIFLETSARQIIDILKNSRQPMLTVCISDAVRQVMPDVISRVAPAPDLAAAVEPSLPPTKGSRRSRNKKTSTPHVRAADVGKSKPVNTGLKSLPPRKHSRRGGPASSAAYRRGARSEPPDALTVGRR